MNSNDPIDGYEWQSKTTKGHPISTYQEYMMSISAATFIRGKDNAI